VSLSEREDERIDFKTAGNDLSISDAKGNDPFAAFYLTKCMGVQRGL